MGRRPTVPLGLLLVLIFFFLQNPASPPSNNLPQALPNVSVDASGKANLNIPISVPVGGSVVPNLVLSYRSDSPNGFLGKGWNISGFESVSMSVTDNPNLPEFSSSITGILLDISGNKTEYRAKNEIYAKVVPSNPADCGSGPCSWIIYTKEGMRYKFGTSANSRINVKDKADVKQWLVDRVEDTNGNGYNISYVIDNTAGFYYPNTITYIDRVIQFNLSARSDQIKEYSNNVGNGMNQIVTGISITAAGETFRNYNFNYVLGVDKVSLLSKVSQTGFKDIDISYNTNPNTIQTVAGVPTNTNVDYRVPFFNQGKCNEVRGYCACTAIPGCASAAVTASYGLIDPREECATGTISLGDLCTNGMQTGPFSIMADVTGDGKADIIKIVGGQNDNHIQVLRLNESGGTDSSLSPPIQFKINSYISVADIDGNGRQEVLYAEDNNSPLKVAYYDLATNSFTNIQTMGNIVVDTLSYDPNNINLVSRNFTSDINGDKRSDFVSIYDEGTNTRLKIYISNGSGFQTGYEIVTPNLGTADTIRFFMDMNGDGRPEWIQMQNDNPKEMKVSTLDLVAKTSNLITYPFDLSAGTAKTTNFKNISFADVNSDGKIDLTAVLDDGTVSVALFTENGFAPAQLSSLPTVAPQYLAIGENTFQETQNTVAYSDVNGDGKDDLVYSKNGTLYISYSNRKGYTAHNDTKPLSGAFQLADVTGNGKADIIGLGITEKPKTPIFQFQSFRVDSDTPVEYTGSANLVVQGTSKAPTDIVKTVSNNDGQTVNVSYALNRDLPGVVIPNNGTYPNLPDLSAEHLVTTVVTDPGGGLPATKETYEYGNKRYYSGTNDVAGSLGFKSVTKTSSLLTVNGEEVITKIVTDCEQTTPFATGLPTQTKIYNGSGGLQQVLSYQYEVGTTANGTKEYRNKTVSNSIYENNQYLFQNTITNYYDQNGNIYRDISNTEGNIEETNRTYNADTSNWILDRVATSTITKGGIIIENSNTQYSGQNITSVANEIEPGVWATSSFVYDANGRLVSETNPLGKTLNYSYDSSFNPLSVSDSNGSSLNVEYDPLTGQMKKTVDRNLGVTEIKYDSYGRITETKEPNAVDWSEQFIYSDDPANQYTEKRTNTTLQTGFFLFLPIGLQGSNSYDWVREYFDKDGNKVKIQTSAIGGKVLQKDFIYDSKGNLSKESKPYLVGEEMPQFNIYSYNVNNRINSIEYPDGKVRNYSMNNLIYSDAVTGKQTITSKRNVLGQYTEIARGGIKNTYEYYPDGRLKQITDPSGKSTLFEYNRRGNVTSNTNSNTGNTNYTYDLTGNLLSSRDANGRLNQFNYDVQGRLTQIKNDEETIDYTYDEAGENTKGRLTTVKDSSGTTKYFYDKVGNIIKTIRKFDDYTIQFQNRYDSKNRLIQKIYPDNTVATYTYNEEGLANIKIKTSDGKIDDQILVEYSRDKANGKLTEKYGNGVTTSSDFDLLSGKITGIKTTTSRNAIEQQKEYKFDTNNNITEILDSVNPAKNQTFEYDDFNRLTKAKGKYGEEAYTYTNSGNLTKKGDIQLVYADSSRPHAVTKIQKPHETINLEYDSTGKLTKRNNDKYIHDALGRLSSIQTSDGQEFQYVYNYNGRRVKKVNRLKTEVTYYFEDGLYEIHKVPGKPDEHTLYFLEGNTAIAQWTRTDAVLPTINLSTAPIVPSPWLTRMEENYNRVVEKLNSLGDVNVSSSWSRTTSAKEFSYINVSYLLLLLIPLVIYLVEKRTFVGYTLSISIVSLVFVACTGKKDQFPFAALALAGGINSETPGVGGDSNTSGNGQVGGGGSSAGTPVAGFYFLHRDYLDSVTMITDGKGEMVSGMDLATGKSVVDYKPYGEIDRKNSDGPDIFRYKYTGQEEDRETGLYYYKARYYDPEMGRFIQPDSYFNQNTPFGMNLYAYVEGNPIMNNDPSGHKWKLSHVTNGKIAKSMTFRRHHKVSPFKDLNLRRSWAGKQWGQGPRLSPQKVMCGKMSKKACSEAIGALMTEGTDSESNSQSDDQEELVSNTTVPKPYYPLQGLDNLPLVTTSGITDAESIPLSPNPYQNTDEGYTNQNGFSAAGIELTLRNTNTWSDFHDTLLSPTSVPVTVLHRYNVNVTPWDICVYGIQQCSYNGGLLYLGLNNAGKKIRNRFTYDAYSYTKSSKTGFIKKVLKAKPVLWHYGEFRIQ